MSLESYEITNDDSSMRARCWSLLYSTRAVRSNKRRKSQMKLGFMCVGTIRGHDLNSRRRLLFWWVKASHGTIAVFPTLRSSNRMLKSVIVVSLLSLYGVLGLQSHSVWPKSVGQDLRVETDAALSFSKNVSSCPGYTLTTLTETSTGLTANLNLAGDACNAFGLDIANLSLHVNYDSNERLHVHIYDTANSQFTIPSSIIPLPSPPTEGAPVIPGDSSTALDGFPLVFEDQYLQLTSALPYGANIYGLGEVVASSGFRRDVGTDGGVGTIQTMWARDDADPIDQNMFAMTVRNHGAGFGPLNVHTLATNATHAGGYVDLDVHNMFGLMEEKTTHIAVKEILGIRPFLISRSTFPSSGKWSGHWLGDNWSLWTYLHYNIQGVLQFQLFQIPMVGADTCGFSGNTDEELCNRWMQLSAFMPFFRNHNQRGALSQEPYRWDSVANASRTAIATRYSLLPYWYTLFANASSYGTPVIHALFYEFPDEPELFAIDRQYMIGRDILVTPVLTPNVSTVDGILPGRGKTIWRDWYTHCVVNATIGGNTTLDAPLGHINVHVRGGSAILLHAQPAYTIWETRQGPYELLVSLSADGSAFGSAYIDDGESIPPTPNRTLTFSVTDGSFSITSSGDFNVAQKLEAVTVLGISKPTTVVVQGEQDGVTWEFIEGQQELRVQGLGWDLNNAASLFWG
ncbi:hypothetical protein POSPLDRAFT_93878 [Postia placenta Mad-698-R]|nr:hypothetical protein POSPLDRAFT_93878 [Postia placenta Mad-698-R]